MVFQDTILYCTATKNTTGANEMNFVMEVLSYMHFISSDITKHIPIMNDYAAVYKQRADITFHQDMLHFVRNIPGN